MRPFCQGDSRSEGQNGDAIRLLCQLGEHALKLGSWVQVKYIWNAKNSNPSSHKGVPHILGSLDTVVADNLYLLARNTPTDYIQVETPYAIWIFYFEQVNADHLTESVGSWDS